MYNLQPLARQDSHIRLAGRVAVQIMRDLVGTLAVIVFFAGVFSPFFLLWASK